MKEEQYANILNERHVSLIMYLNEDLKDDKVTTVGFGNKTQHIFKGNNYYMTVNWDII
jgi:hypothetical protein